MASGAGTGRSRSRSADRRYPYLAICVQNRGNEVSLELGKAYKVIKPLAGDPAGRIRVIDEEGDDYLYLAEWFVPIEVPSSRKRQVMAAVASGE